jgi:hypothetical protein
MMNPNDRYVLQGLLQVVKDVNPDYPADFEIDAPALRKIAGFIYKQLQRQDFLISEPTLFNDVWRQLYTTAYKDQFYQDKSLATIANHIQEFYQKAKHGSKQISGSKLADKLASRLNKR